MPTPIGTAELAILREHVVAADRNAYYQQLAEWGYRYGELAEGVVNNDALPGSTANHYFDIVSIQEGVLVSPNSLGYIGLNLMVADFLARSAPDAPSRLGQDLAVDTIQAYHEDVFNAVGVSGNAWTPTIALDAQTSLAAREALWDSLLDAGITDSISFLANAALTNLTYGQNLVIAGSEAVLSSSGDFGNYGIAYSFDGINNVYVIGGTASSESLTGISTMANTILGFAGADTITGGNLDDRIYGGEGSDRLIGGGGADRIDGGTETLLVGADTYVDSYDFGAMDILIGIENVEGGSGDGSYSLDGALDDLFGGLFSPFRMARVVSTPDTESTETRGPASLANAISLGVAELEMSPEGDLALVLTSTGATALTISDFNWGDAGIFLDTGREAGSTLGTEGDDVVQGSRHDDLLVGAGGDDRVLGHKGSDELSGEAGDDSLYGNHGADSLYGDRGEDALFGGANSDSLWGGADNDVLRAAQGHDQLSGGAGDDRLYAASGNDTLIGGLGDDTLTGGSGADTFVFETGDGQDLIRDFSASQGDVIEIGVAGIASFADLVLTEAANGTLVDLGGGDSLLLRGLDVADVTEDLFILV